MSDEPNERDAPDGGAEAIEPIESIEYTNYFDDTAIHNFIQAHRINMDAPRPAKPREAQEPPEHWVDRDEMLARLEALLRAESPRPIALGGARGAGKSSLAAKLAASLERRFEDGQLYIDLGLDDPLTAMRDVLMRLGQPKEYLGASLGGLRSQYRSTTKDRSLLVIVDGVPNPESGLLFKPASASGALMMLGREWPAGGDFDAYEVNELSPEHAVQYLLGTCPELSEQDATAYVAGRPWLPANLERLVGYVRTLGGAKPDPTGRESVELSPDQLLEATYLGLSEPAAWLYRLLGAVPGEQLEYDALRAIDAWDRQVVDELIAARLVTETDGRCRLTVEPPQSGALSIDLAPAVRLLVRYYAERAQLADRAVMGKSRLRRTTMATGVEAPDFTAGEDAEATAGAIALRWLRDNRRELVGAVRMAAVCGWRREALALAEALWPLFSNLPYPELGAECYRAAVDAAEDAQTRARMLVFLGRVLIDLPDHAESDAKLSQAVALASEAGDEALRCSALEQRGWLHYRRRRLDEAERTYLSALDIARRLERERSQALLLKLLGFVYRDRRDAGRARRCFAEAVALFRSCEDHRNTAVVRAELALLDVGDPQPAPEAVMLADKAIGDIRALGLERFEAEALERLGLALGGDDGRARLEAALEILARLGSGDAERVRRMLA